MSPRGNPEAGPEVYSDQKLHVNTHTVLGFVHVRSADFPSPAGFPVVTYMYKVL